MTRFLMSASALVLGLLGLVTTFAPDYVLSSFGAPPTPALLLVTQVLGALYVGFAGLNWMARGNLIGGMYSRPVAIGNRCVLAEGVLGSVLEAEHAGDPPAPVFLVPEMDEPGDGARLRAGGSTGAGRGDPGRARGPAGFRGVIPKRTGCRLTEGSDRSEQLDHSWDTNAAAWTRVVRDRLIESRRLVTDAAILEAITSLDPRSILDVGCGEGWLCRAAQDRGIRAVGLDGSVALIEAAREAGAEEYHHIRYRDFAELAAALASETFDAAVFNFSLLDEEIGPVLGHVAGVVRPGGSVVIQTVHPWAGRGDGPYADGWRTEDFAAIPAPFQEPMPWYYRTLGSLADEFRDAGLAIHRLIEPRHPDTGHPASLIVVASVGAAGPTAADGSS